MRHTLWALALLATLTLTAAAQREATQSAGGGGSSGGGSSGSSSSGSSGGGYSGGSSSDSGGGSWSGSSGGSSSRDYGGGGSSSSSGASSSRDSSGGGSSGSSGASTSRGASGSSHSSGSAGGASASGSGGASGSSRGSSVAPVLDDGPPRPPLPGGKQPDKRPPTPPASPVAPAPGVPAPGVGKNPVATPTAPVERNARPEAFPHNPCYPHGVQQGGSCVPCPGGQLATVVNQCVAPPERNEAFDCELHPSNWGCGQSTSQGASLSCAWLLRQVEEEESELAQLNQQRSAACGQDASGADCQALSAQYQQLVQQVRQDQAAYNRCQISHR